MAQFAQRLRFQWDAPCETPKKWCNFEGGGAPPWSAFVQSVLQCQSALKTGDFWCLPKPLGSSPGAPGESLEESFLGHVEPLFWSQSFVQKMPVLGAERPSVPELLWVVVETMFEIFLNNDFSCLLKGWACKVAEFTRFYAMLPYPWITGLGTLEGLFEHVRRPLT